MESNYPPLPPPKPFTIGLRALAGAGKSTIQKLICDFAQGRRSHTGSTTCPTFYPYSMAGPIRDALKIMGVDKLTTPDLYRRMAQWIGTEGCRAYDDDWWVKLADRKIRELSPQTVVVIDDIRFPNEGTLCDILFFFEPTFPPLNLGANSNHASEKWNIEREGRIDHVISNEHHDPARAAISILSITQDALSRRSV